MQSTSDPSEVDVLIVGYGPVGASLAGLLGRYGVRTLVIEKAQGIFTAPRAIALDNEALRILQLVGLREGDFACLPIPFITMRSPRVGEFARVNTAHKVDGHPALVTFFQPELERALRKHAERQDSVAARSGVVLIDLRQDAEGVRARVRTMDGKEEFIHARYLVGADGASSTVRAAIGERFDGQTYAEDWLIVDALDVPNSIDHVEFICDPDRPIPHMAAPGGRTRWEFALRPGETREEMERDSTIAELLRPWATPGEYRIERKAVYRFHARSCRRFSRGRIYLVGDAAHITPPFIGQGLVSGLRDAANLAWKLAWVLKGRASATILDSYDQERRPHASKMIALARITGLLVMPRSHLRAWLSHGALKWLRQIPLLRPHFDEFRVKPANAYARGLFVRGRGRRIRHGAWFPQGFVRDGAGNRKLSDELLGLGFSLVCTGTVSPPLDAATAHAWEAVGGTTTRITAKGNCDVLGVAEDADDTFSKLTATPWCVVVRPDRTVLHHGPLAEVNRIVSESIALLRGDSPRQSGTQR